MSEYITPYSISEFTSDFFNNSSIEWRKNKKIKKNRITVYKCCWIHRNGKRCIKTTIDSKKENKYIYTMDYSHEWIKKENSNVFCKQHINRPYCENIHYT